MDELKAPGKPFQISKREVWDAWLKVKGNKGAPGVDGQSIEAFEKDLKDNLYRIWNRMSSGTYFPPPVMAVEIPRPHGGGTRVLGVPCVADRIAQTVAAARLESAVEPVFHPDSYGYRPRRGALDAVAACRKRCWEHSWVIDFDIRKFFDSVPWDLIVNRGTPQGSAISPVIANLFMHYAFDRWLEREFPAVEFERYADDGVIHCVSQYQARMVLAALHERMAEVGLELHPDKTRIVYCKDSNRRGSYEHTSFTFLGFTFRPRGTRREDGVQFTGFLPAISKDALKKISAEVRSWRLHRWVTSDGREIARLINPKVRGWMTYYGEFNRAALYPLLRRINTYLLRWIMRKYKKHSTWKKAIKMLAEAAANRPRYFAHWAWVKPATR
ncbi:MAG: group II intron reverse transcriptase/maturase [Streptosporangiaceae bacterium]